MDNRFDVRPRSFESVLADLQSLYERKSAGEAVDVPGITILIDGLRVSGDFKGFGEGVIVVENSRDGIAFVRLGRVEALQLQVHEPAPTALPAGPRGPGEAARGRLAALGARLSADFGERFEVAAHDPSLPSGAATDAAISDLVDDLSALFDQLFASHDGRDTFFKRVRRIRVDGGDDAGVQAQHGVLVLTGRASGDALEFLPIVEIARRLDALL